MSQDPANIKQPEATGEQPLKPGLFYRVCRAVFVGFVLFYVGTCVLVFCFQRKLLFVPPVRSPEEVATLAQQAGLERWTNSAGTYLGMKRIFPGTAPRASILICYGNGGSATGRGAYADELQSVAPLDIYILQYPGYEDRPGEPTRESLLKAAETAFEAIGTNQPVYLLGESLGTGLVSYLAGRSPDRIAGIVLLSPYERLADVAQYQYPWLPARWLMLDDLWAGNFLANYRGPVAVSVDGQDQIVPAYFGRKLYHDYNGPKKLWEFPELGHIQIAEPEEKFWREVVDFWQASKS